MSVAPSPPWLYSRTYHKYVQFSVGIHQEEHDFACVWVGGIGTAGIVEDHCQSQQSNHANENQQERHLAPCGCGKSREGNQEHNASAETQMGERERERRGAHVRMGGGCDTVHVLCVTLTKSAWRQ